MTNMIRKARVSLSIGEIHSTYLLLESIKAGEPVEPTLNPFLESMRIVLKKKLVEEEEGLLGTAFNVRAEPKPRKYGMDGLGFSSTKEALNPNASNFNEVMVNLLNESLGNGKESPDGQEST